MSNNGKPFEPMDWQTRVSSVELKLLNVNEMLSSVFSSLWGLLGGLIVNFIVVAGLVIGGLWLLAGYRSQLKSIETVVDSQAKQITKVESQLKMVEGKLAKFKNTGDLP